MGTKVAFRVTYLFSCLRASGYYGIFGFGLVLSIINMAYIMLYVKETRGPRAHPRYVAVQRESHAASDLGGEDNQPSNLLSLAHLKSVFTTAMKKRPNNMRAVLLMLISAMILNQTANRKWHTQFCNDIERVITKNILNLI